MRCPTRKSDMSPGAPSRGVIGAFSQSKACYSSRRHISIFLMTACVFSLGIYNPMLLIKFSPTPEKNRNLRRPHAPVSWHAYPNTVLSHNVTNATKLPRNCDSNESLLLDTDAVPPTLYYKNTANDMVPANDGIPLFDESCVPMSHWQTEYHPNCNSLHSLNLMNMELLGYGNARMVFKLGSDEDAVLKVTRHQKVQKRLYESWRVDAILSEQLTASPNVIDIYGHCGLSNLNQIGVTNPRWYKQHHQTPSDKVQLALNVSRALLDVHSLDGNDIVTAIWRNLKPENVLFAEGQLRITDFDESILLRKHNVTNEPCKFHLTMPEPRRFQPIELSLDSNNLDEKIDIYSLGAILYAILVGRRPYGHLSHHQLKSDGVLPEFPSNLSNDTLTETLRDLSIKCMAKDARNRPRIQDVVRELERVLAEKRHHNGQ